ncbi:MAG: hypothetical protein ACYC5M_01395 [Anaerolineae bacterium]
MAKSVIALYDDLSDAQAALQDLVDSGFSNRDISLLRRHEGDERGVADERGNKAGEGAGIGAGIGAVLGGAGGLLVGLGLLTIPGIGPVLAAGPLAAALAGAGIGAVGGAVLGALVGLGVPEEQAHYYAEGVRRGGTLVALKADSAMVESASSVLRRHHPVNIDQRAETWRAEGWTEFSPEAEPYPAYNRSLDRDSMLSEDITSEDITYEEETIGETGAVREMRSRDEDVGYEGRSVDSSGVAGAEYGKADVSRGDYSSGAAGADYRQADVSGAGMGEADLDSTYRRHFDSTYASTGYDFDRYRPAYRYGHDLAEVERNRSLGWDAVEPEARRRWEDRNPGTWGAYMEAVRAGFMAARERSMTRERM